MISLTGYHISAQIHHSSNSLVYRGYRKSDRLPIVLKVLRQDYPSPAQLTRYQQEYQVTYSLDLGGVVKAYSLVRYQNTLVIVFEDFGGESLRVIADKRKIDLAEFLSIAIAIVKALEKIHQAQIVHKDLNPSNIVYNPQTQELKIIDFGIATRLTQESLTFKNPNLLEGTLGYVSPEQTGRTNRNLDYRSDFYSLGITFYELLRGQLPFKTQDPLELIHCHLAKQPPDLATVDSAIPEAISQIVAMLMAKNAEDRYQNAYGIRADLEACLMQLETKGKIESFPLGRKDLADKFQIPQKLYGRDSEIASLLTAFARVTGQEAKSELCLVSGYSGIGKTSLVKEIYRSITATKGYFISGKFELGQRDIPYYGLLQAFKKLIEQLLTENPDRIKQWQERLRTALGVNGQVIIDVIPEVELIIGQQPPTPELEPAEAQNRFNLVFQNFIQVFARSEHPLVLFLDDLQWADIASLKLIELLVNAPGIVSLLTIGAYRSNEVDPSHPVTSTIEAIAQSGIKIQHITLNSLNLADINQLVADTLHNSFRKTQLLARLLQKKTAGNPFFLREFFQALAEDKLLEFDFVSGSWQWDLEQIQAQQITDNVVDLMVKKIKKLPIPAQEVLIVGSCIGSQFEISLTAKIAALSPNQTALYLHDAITLGFILPLNSLYQAIELDITHQDFPQIVQQVEYKFVHDKIQQAAYSLIDPAARARLHFKIGSLLLQDISPEKQSEKIFDLVHQLNQGHHLINQTVEKDKIARLNLIAARKALKATAYQSAWEYAERGLRLLGDRGWQRQYAMVLEFHNLGAKLAALRGDLATMEELVARVIACSHTLLDQIPARRIQIQTRVSQNQPLKAIALAQKLLQQLGIVLPDAPTPQDVRHALEEISTLIAPRKIGELLDLPVMNEREKIAIVEIANSVITPAFVAGSPLFPLLVALAVKISIQHGNAPASAPVYACYGIIACNQLQDVQAGIEFGQLALLVADKLNAQAFKTQVYNVIGLFIIHRQSPMRDTLKLLQTGYAIALEVGNQEMAGYSVEIFCLNSLGCGQFLPSLTEKTAAYWQELQRQNQLTTADYCRIFWQFMANLQEDKEQGYLSGSILAEADFIPKLISASDLSGLYYFHLFKLILCYVLGEIALARQQIIEVERYLIAGEGTIGEPLFYFYDSLVALAKLDDLTSLSPEIESQVERNQQRLKNQWAQYAPMNYQHKYFLVEAEKNRVLGQHSQAIDLYDRAIDLASQSEFTHETALAYELAAKFYLNRGNKLIASTYMKQARFSYSNWGAKNKVKHLDTLYPELLATVGSYSSGDLHHTYSSTNQESLDLNTLVKTSLALAQINDLSLLLQTLIKFAIENAGAERGFLILSQGENLFLEASGTAESIITLQHDPLDSCPHLCTTIVNYVYRTQTKLVLNNASTVGLFVRDRYINNNQIQSVLCLPIINQGHTLGILYLENNLLENAFTPERLEVIKLISSQAAISIENTLLRQQSQEPEFTYQVGGCLTVDAPTYVVRQADLDLYKYLQQGHYCYVLNCRHMGKSSLRVRIVKKLSRAGFICTAIDLTSIGSQNITTEQWYAGLTYSLVNNLNLATKADFRHWWHSLDFLSPVHKFKEFIDQILLPKIPGKIIIFLDEIDSILGLNFNLDDFFCFIRSCYNHRASDPRYQRLSFVFLGVAYLSSLIKNKTCTPFNIGQKISLQGFQLHEVSPLIQGLTPRHTNPQALIKAVLFWTEGQPFLTQKICCLIVESSTQIPQGQETEWVAALVAEKIINNWEAQDNPQHLKTIYERLVPGNELEDNLSSRKTRKLKTLQLYCDILHNKIIPLDRSEEQKELILSGIVRQTDNILKVYNPIYQTVFDLRWCKTMLS